MGAKLTDISIRNLKSRDCQRDVFDQSIPAFGVRVTPRGSKSFFVFYRIDGKLRRYTLGRWPVLSVGKARTLAREALLIAVSGKDPQLVKDTDRRHGKPPFDAFVDEFVSTYCKPRNRTWSETERLLKREFVPQWGARPIHRIARNDIHQALDSIIARGSPALANAALAAVRKLFSWAVERGHLESSPCASIGSPSPLVSRDRVLKDDEIVRIWSGSGDMGYPYRDFLRLLLLTAQRRSEVAEMRWSEVDLANAVWEIPGQRTKNGKTHTLPLSATAVAILTGMPRTHETLVFPARDRENPISGFAKWKAELDKLSDVENWRLHDLRRTAASNMARLKVPPHVIEKVLNHSSGTLGGVAGIYNRHGYLDEMREALEIWSSHLGQIVGAPFCLPQPG